MPLYRSTLRVPDGEAECYPACGDDDIVVGQPVFGCTDETACNYWEAATVDNGSCFYLDTIGCTNPNADNYDPDSNPETGLCQGLCTFHEGCTNTEALNWDEQTNYAVNVLYMSELNNEEMCVFDDDDEDIEVVQGCTNSDAENYNELANTNDGSCTFSEEFYAAEDDEQVVEEDDTFGARASKFVEDNKVLLGVLAVAVVGYVIYKRR